MLVLRWDRAARSFSLSDPSITLRRSLKVRLLIFPPRFQISAYLILTRSAGATQCLCPCYQLCRNRNQNRSLPGQTTARGFEICAELLDRMRNECHSPPYSSVPLPPHNLVVIAGTRLVLDLGTYNLYPRHRIQVFDGNATIDPFNAS